MALKRRAPVGDLLIYVPTVTATAYSPGDLLYLNSGVATLASAQADGGTEAGNQATFADNFLGVCHGKKLASNTGTDEIAVVMDGEIEADCDSTTWAVGELVAAQEQSNGTQLENQKVKKTSTRADAIGMVSKAATSATKVRFILWSRNNKPILQGS